MATAILLAGNGLQSALVPIRADLEGFTTFEIAALGSAYFAGVLIGSVLIPSLVSAVGHVRTHSAMTALVAAVTLAYSLAPDPVWWIVLRVLYGIFLSGIYLVVESWLSDRSDNTSRGSVLSVYTVINLVMMAVGQMLINLADPLGHELFILSALLVSLAAVPVALSRSATPTPAPTGGLRLATIANLPRVALIGAITGGITTGAFWGLGPVFAEASGMTTRGVSLFLAATIMGGAVWQWPLGRLSDLVDRRRVIILCLVGAAAAGTYLHMMPGLALREQLLAVFAFGAFAFPLYAVSVAHSMDWAEADEVVPTATALLFLTGLGALAGPLMAATVIGYLGESALFLFTSMVHGSAAVVAVVMIATKAPVDVDQKVEFQLAPRTTPVAYELSDYGEEGAADEAEAAVETGGPGDDDETNAGGTGPAVQSA